MIVVAVNNSEEKRKLLDFLYSINYHWRCDDDDIEKIIMDNDQVCCINMTPEIHILTWGRRQFFEYAKRRYFYVYESYKEFIKMYRYDANAPTLDEILELEARDG